MREIELFYDVGSPYTYLAVTQMDALEQRTGVPVRYRPFLLGAVFKAANNVAPANVAAKARWMSKDLERWAAHYAIPYRMSSHFPLNTLTTQRALVAADRLGGQAALRALTRPLFDAYWVEDRDVSSPAVIVEVARAAGLDGDAIIAASQEPATKDALRASTDEAVARGAFGAPTLFVGEDMFFGNDRLDLLEELLTH